MIKHLDEYFALARERETIRQRKERGDPPPWTQDEVLANWRFCNVHREHDRVTRWFAENVRCHLVPGKNAITSTVAFRWFNRPETGQALLPLLLGKWDTKKARAALAQLPPPHVTGAYMVRSPVGVAPKWEGILQVIDRNLPALRALERRPWTSLRDLHTALHGLELMGRFTSYEVVSDLRWTPVLDGATDIFTWASAGPGCARGLGWTMYGDPEAFNYGSDAHQERMLLLMETLLRASTEQRHWPQEWRPWEMREVEHWACEVWKYARARFRGGRLKQRYTPQEGTTP